MKKVRLTESDLMRIVKRIINEGAVQKNILLDCAARTADGTQLTAEQITKWCSGAQPQTQTTGGGSGGID